jgi:hypothetical protein
MMNNLVVNTGDVCSNLPAYPQYCTRDQCFTAHDSCLAIANQCQQLYPSQNTKWYISLTLS